DKNKPKNIVIIGAGFIGLEVAESLIEKGLNVVVLEAKPTVLKFDDDMSPIAENELRANGIDLRLNVKISEIDNKNNMIKVVGQDDVPFDLIFKTAGLAPNSKFLDGSGVKVDEKGIILTNEFMQTNNKDIYAGGDLVYSTHVVTGKKVFSPLAWGANRQAKVIANHINGFTVDKQPPTFQTAIIKLFRLPAAQTGLTEFEAKQLGIDYDTSFVNLNNHAGYYPGSQKVSFKLIFDNKSKRILGAQSIGPSSDKKIDIIVSAIAGKLNIHQLLDLNLSYSPPYGSAKDVVNVAAAVAINKIQRKYKTKLARDIKFGEITIDVRPTQITEINPFKLAVNIPLIELRKRISEIPKNEEVNIICSTGHDSYNAISILLGLGYTKLTNISGGLNLYKEYLKAKEGIVKKRKSINSSVKPLTKTKVTPTGKEIVVDCSGLACPGPIMKLHKAIKEGQDGDIFNVTATDFGFEDDIVTWAEKNKHTLLSVSNDGSTVKAIISKGSIVNSGVGEDAQALAHMMMGEKENATIVLFSGDYDKAIAALIIAQAASSIGKKVTVFATFWGLNALRVKPAKGKAPKKKFMKKMFGAMMPLGVDKMGLSSMNMGGMGKKLIASTMKKHNVKSPSEMLKDSIEIGVDFIACTMSMDLLGITKEEIIEGASFAGAAKYVSKADDSNITLFI
ncbi:MAG: DsrE/DsrF/DrsH-like family protein, partial [Mycoplasmataceae bacterium]|nr:DsrE/DsrF/DrsH-like family protein [Mycoplasmataceae bacterium]